MCLVALGFVLPYAYGTQTNPEKNAKKEQQTKVKKSDTKSNKTNTTNTKTKDKDKNKDKDKTSVESKKKKEKNNKESDKLLSSSKANSKNENPKNRSKTLANKNNLDAYPAKIIGMYASGTNKNACAPVLAIYKKTKQWPSLQISTQKVSNPAEKLSCKPAKIKAMDGNFYVAENCRNEKNRSSDRHLIYIKNNDSLRVNSDNKTQVYVECNVKVANK